MEIEKILYRAYLISFLEKDINTQIDNRPMNFDEFIESMYLGSIKFCKKQIGGNLNGDTKCTEVSTDV